jgi:hypothetical protein
MHRRSSHRALIYFTPLLCALAFGVLPAIANAATPGTSCTVVAPATPSNPCYTAAPAIVAPAGQPATEVTSPQVGRYIQGNPGTWTPPQPYPSVQWTQDCNLATVPATLGTPIPGAINRTYQIADTDVGHTLCLIVNVSNGVQAVTGPTGTVAPGTPLDQVSPTISGTTEQGKTLTATPGTWRGTGATTGGITFTYQWKRCNSSGAVCGVPFTAPSTSATYVLQTTDVGHTMQVLVTAKNSAGTTQAGAKKPTAVVTAPAPPNGSGQGGSNNNNGSGNGSNNGGQTGGPQGGTGSSSSPGNAVNVRALLMHALFARGKSASIRSLLKHGGYSFSFAAPSAGRLQVLWYRLVHGRRLLVGTVTFTFRKAGSAKIEIRVTRAGRNLLGHAGKLRLTASAGFTPVGLGTTIASRTITLNR